MPSVINKLYCTRLLPALLVLLFTLPVQHARAMNLDEVGAGELLFQSGSGWQPSVQLGTRVDMQVSGMVARVTVEQRFRNAQDDWADGTYVFPLPESAAVSDMRIEVDGRVIVGEIREKQAAEKIFKAAQAAGKRAALLDQGRPNLFRTRVANLGPGQEISVTLTYLEKVRYNDGAFELRFPMTLTQKYEGEAGPAQMQGTQSIPEGMRPRYEERDAPRNPVQITANIDAGMALAGIDSPYHPIVSERVSDRADTLYRVALANNIVPMDHDFVLRWRPVPDTAPRAALFAEDVDGDTYALLMVLPPERLADTPRLARELVFVVDTSGSMGGVSIEAARSAMQTALASLAPTDRFNVITFDNSANKLWDEARLADGSYLQDAWTYINNIEAGNGTNMEAALRAALEDQPDLPPGTVRQVVLLTDGGVWASDELFRLIDRQRAQSKLFTVGIGSAPDNYFMRKAAQFGGGRYTYIAHAGEAEAVMGELFEVLSAPQLQGLSVGWSDRAESFPARVPDLYAGEPLVITAKIRGTDRPLIAGIRDANGQWQQNVRLLSPGAHTGVATLWARDKLEALYDQITEGGDSERLREAIVATGLRHRLVSRYTSFVAVEQTPVRPADTPVNRRQVANARPAGQVIALPQTDAGTFGRLLIGAVSLLLAGIFGGRRHET